MRTENINGNIIEIYDSIEQLPMVRFHAFSRGIMLDSGIGSDVDDIDKRMASSIAMIQKGDHGDAIKEINNMRAALANVMGNINPKMLSFASLVKSINGKECNDLSHNGLTKVLDMIGQFEISYNTVATVYNEVKKKLKKKSVRTSKTSRIPPKHRNFLNI